MHRTTATISGLAFLVASMVSAGVAAPGTSDFYAGKRLTLIVGLESGGTVDTLARMFADFLRKHIPGNPTIVVQNMPGGGGSIATNYLRERAANDGSTILYGPWDPLAQALGDQVLHARYEDFEYLGGTGDIRVVYARTDLIAGGLEAPRDIVKARGVIVGALNRTDISGLLPKLVLEVLGVGNRMIIGYRGGSDVFLAMQRNEVQFHSTSISSFRTRNADFVKSGQAIGIAYLAPMDRNGGYRKSEQIIEMPSFPDLYREVFGRLPAGPKWDALNWLTNQTGELTFAALAPPGIPPAALAALRKGFEAASNDPAFIAESTRRNGMPFSFVNVERGQPILRSVGEVTPNVLGILRATAGAF